MTTRKIGVVAPFLTQDFLAAMLDEIHTIARAQNAQVLVFEGTSESVGSVGLARHQVDGWILFIESAGARHFLRTGKPVIGVCTNECSGLCPIVLPDNKGGIQQVMQHLFTHGHERIAFIGTMDNADVQERRASYCTALTMRGLPVDPSLIVDTRGGYREDHGRQAIRELLAAGLHFTAVVAAGDFIAFGAIEALREAGYRVPEDVAVTGFDDVHEAQFTDPPLTSVRQRGEAVGALTAETLLRMLDGQPVPPDPLYAPTALVLRQSCGCETHLALPQPDPAPLGAPGWRDYLLTQMVLLVRHPRPLEPGSVPARIWPGAADLAALLEATLQGQPAPSMNELTKPWREATALSQDIDTLFAILKLLEDTAAAQLAGHPAPGSIEAALRTFTERCRVAVRRAQLSREAINLKASSWQARMRYEIDQALLMDTQSDTIEFDWFARTIADWACLGLWDRSSSPTPMLTIAGLYQREPGAAVALGSRCLAGAFPPTALLDAPEPEGTPSNVVVLPVETSTRQWGLIALRLPSEQQLAYDLYGLQALGPCLAAKLERSTLLASLRTQQATLREAYDREHAAVRSLEARTRVLTLLHMLNEHLDTCDTLELAMEAIGRAMPQLFPATHGALIYRPDLQNGAPLLARWGVCPDTLPLRPELCPAIQPQVSADPDTGCAQCAAPPGAGETPLCVPLQRGAATVGRIQIARRAAPAADSGADEEPLDQLVTIVADQLQLGLANIQLREALRQQALCDPLTNLYNRRYLNETLARLVREQTPFSLVIADIDHFKQINDTWGHPTGDLVIQVIGQQLRRTLRRGDVVCRFGGEEFVLLLPNTPLEVARERAEQLRVQIRDMPIPQRVPLPQVTLSWGIATFPQHGRTPTDLLDRADQALYRAKASGRDRVMLARAELLAAQQCGD